MAMLNDDEGLLSTLRDAVGYGDVESMRQRLQECTSKDYAIMEVLGQGACGIVFKARDIHLNRLVAIKCPVGTDQRRQLVAMFDEARIMAKVNHPNVASVYALSETTEPPFIVAEFVDGRPIDEAVAGFSIEQKLRVFGGVLRGVAELHRHRIVHRDLKPSNILVDGKGASKVLDMGIARQTLEGDSTKPAATDTQGTPAYMAPEQTLGKAAEATADVFSLGVVLFELLTRQRPFAGDDTQQVLQAIREFPPPLPRALNTDIPGPLQAICLTALEKDPTKRYASARDFLLDLERLQKGEPIVANPTLLSDILDHGIERHTADLLCWKQDRLISTREHDYFVDKYDRLRQREEFWVLDSRRISYSQVALHLGAWSCVVSAFLMRFFSWRGLPRPARVSVPLALFAVLFGLGAFLWRRRTKRVAVVLLLAASLTWPLLVATTCVTMEMAWATQPLPDDLFPSDVMNNNQLLVIAGTWCALCAVLWAKTRTGAFSLIWAISGTVLATAVFAFAGMLDQLEQGNIDTVAGWYLLFSLGMFGLAMWVDLRYKAGHLAGPWYVISTAMILAAVTLIAKFGPTTDWLGLIDLPRRDGDAITRHIKYSFMLNGAAYMVVGLLADRSIRSRWLRKISTILFWLAPSHILAPILLLETEWAVLPCGWTIPELLLPIVALCFVFASVPKQMKSFFFSGLFYVAVSVQRLTDRHFEDWFAWPVALAIGGLILALTAWRRPTLFDRKRTG